jgi:hypothetical protein
MAQLQYAFQCHRFPKLLYLQPRYCADLLKGSTLISSPIEILFLSDPIVEEIVFVSECGYSLIDESVRICLNEVMDVDVGLIIRSHQLPEIEVHYIL